MCSLCFTLSGLCLLKQLMVGFFCNAYEEALYHPLHLAPSHLHTHTCARVRTQSCIERQTPPPPKTQLPAVLLRTKTVNTYVNVHERITHVYHHCCGYNKLIDLSLTDLSLPQKPVCVHSCALLAELRANLVGNSSSLWSDKELISHCTESTKKGIFSARSNIVLYDSEVA